MALDNTAKLTNVWQSFKKFLYNNLFTIEGIPIYYHAGIELHATGNDTKWLQASLLPNNLEQFQYQEILIVCATKNDSDGENLYNLRDTLLKYLTDPESANGFRIRMIPIYEISGSGTTRADNEIKGYMEIIRLRQGAESEASNQIKFIPINLTYYFEAKI